MQENISLAPFTTFKVGGPARYFVCAQTETDLFSAIDFASERSLPLLPLGGGSNLVISEEGFPGVVVAIAMQGVNPGEQTAGTMRITVAAGENWDAFVRLTAERGWAGIECLAGIPGTVGATPVQNVGAYGQEVAETIEAVRAYDRREKRIIDLTAAECAFGYRRSRFNTEEPGRWIILSVTFVLRPGGTATVRYDDLTRRLPQNDVSLTTVAETVRAIRARKGMVVDPENQDSWSAGSFFKNPTLTADQFAQISDNAPEIPRYPQPDGTIKVPAAWLMEQAGLRKGQTFGRIALSSSHILALTNRGGGTAAEIVAAAREIQSTVQAKWDIALTPEPLFVGFPENSCLPEGAIRG